MTRILVVDDAETAPQIAAKLREQSAGDFGALDIAFASDGCQALDVLRTQAIDLIVSELVMPGIDGLRLVEEVRLQFPTVPVVLITALGNEELAIRALKRGAAGYVPKRNLDELLPTVVSVLDVTQSRRDLHRLMECLAKAEAHFVLDNDLALIPSLVRFLRDELLRVSGSDESGLMHVTVSLREALRNAMLHGNLELTKSLRRPGGRSEQDLVEERRHQMPYRDRRVHVEALVTPGHAEYVIRDDGPGFDLSRMTIADANSRQFQLGRGLVLISTFMDEVRFNDQGNEVTLVKFTDH